MLKIPPAFLSYCPESGNNILMRLKNKKALVTGAYRGIGKAIADLFLAEGAEVWALDCINPADHSNSITAAKEKLHWIQLDLSHLSQIEGVIQGAVRESEGFDILVNNAGITKDNLASEMSLEDWQKVIDVNLTASFFVARCVSKNMTERRTGSIIYISSTVGIHGNYKQTNYSASKAGIIGSAKSLACEIAGYGVRVNVIAPGYIETDMTAALPEEIQKSVVDYIPLGRNGKPDDVAQAALFFASDASSYITGQVLPVDGGMHF